MKKLLLSMVALMTVAIGASADEPLYAAKGAISSYPSYETYNYVSAVTVGTEVTVEMYGKNAENDSIAIDSIIVRDWCGVEGYDIKFVYEDGSMISANAIVNDVELDSWKWNTYMYVDTGLSNFPIACFNTDYWYQWKVDDYTQAISFCPWMCPDDKASTYDEGSYYYYLTWNPSVAPSEKPYTTVGTIYNYYESYGYKVLGNAATATVEEYANDSTIIRSWCGVEGYDMAIIGNTSAGISRLIPIVNGVPNYYSADGYDYIDTGLSDWAMALEYDNYAYFWDADGYRYLIITPRVYDDTKLTNEATDKYNYCIYWKIADDTGIGTVKAEATQTDGLVYNLAGQRVGKDVKGLLIKNGKKVVVK